MAFPKIVYPSQPATPAPPAAAPVTGGALALRTYYWLVSYVTPYGVTLPCAEQSLQIPADNLCRLQSPAAPSAPTAAVGWNIYAAADEGEETLQNASPIPIGTAWTEPSSGLISGSGVPSTWGATLTFRRPATHIPYSWPKGFRYDSFSTAGSRQTIGERVEKWLKLDVEWIGVGSDLAAWFGADPDVAAWSSFLDAAVLGIPFDYYPDASQANFITYALMEPERVLEYKTPGQYTVSLTLRQEMQLVTPPPGVAVPPTSAARWVVFTAPAAGDFSLAHSLGYSPNGGSAPVLTSPGGVWFQSALWDSVNLYLVASDAGITGMVLVW